MFKIKYLTIVIVASVIITYALMFYQEGEANKELILKWIDASFATGLFIASPGLLIFVANSGVLSVLVFYVVKFFYFITRDARSYDMDLSIYLADKNVVPPFTYMYMFVIGGLYLATSGILLFIYNQ
jgi:hypothetical protein